MRNSAVFFSHYLDCRCFCCYIHHHCLVFILVYERRKVINDIDVAVTVDDPISSRCILLIIIVHSIFDVTKSQHDYFNYNRLFVLCLCR